MLDQCNLSIVSLWFVCNTPNRTHDYSIRAVTDDGKMYGTFGDG